YFVAGVLICGIFVLLKFIIGKRKIKRLRIMSNVSLLLVFIYMLESVLVENRGKWDEVFLPIAVILILFWNFYGSYISYTRERNFNKRRFLIVGGVYSCLFLLGLPLYPYLESEIKNIIGIGMAIGNALFLSIYFYRKWTK
ncbi:MAG: hypothetical protein K6F62_07055, partial [Schwartzia sp.]|nr:hypothetical protein [Schwartzia sp. (in: firmicutes)]